MIEDSAGDRQNRSSPLLRPIWALAISAFVINAVFRFVFPNIEAFAASAVSKRILLPVLYIAATVAILVKKRPDGAKLYPLPTTMKWLLAILVASIFAALFYPRQELNLSDLLQGGALFVGFVALERLGALLAHEPVAALRRLFGFFTVVGVVVLYLGVSMNPFSALAVPACFYGMFVSIRERDDRGRLRTLLMVAITVAAPLNYVVRATPEHPLSVAFAAQIGVCACLTIAALMPVGMRKLLLALGGLVAAEEIVRSQVWRIFYGDSNFADVTIAHRGYETEMVQELLAKSGISRIFGMGPSGTVSLLYSPDAATLRSAGRDLSAVDDVHLITSYLLLKFGVLGLIWLALFFMHAVRILLTVLKQERVSVVGLGLMLFLSAGIANSITAATNFFSNPLTGLCFGAMGAALWMGTRDQDRPIFEDEREPAPERELVQST